MMIRHQGIQHRNAQHQRHILAVDPASAPVIHPFISQEKLHGRSFGLSAAKERNHFALSRQIIGKQQRGKERGQQQAVHYVRHIGHGSIPLIQRFRRIPCARTLEKQTHHRHPQGQQRQSQQAFGSEAAARQPKIHQHQQRQQSMTQVEAHCTLGNVQVRLIEQRDLGACGNCGHLLQGQTGKPGFPLGFPGIPAQPRKHRERMLIGAGAPIQLHQLPLSLCVIYAGGEGIYICNGKVCASSALRLGANPAGEAVQTVRLHRHFLGKARVIG